MRARQAFIEETGGPEVIRWRDAELGDPGAGQALVRNEAVGVNFIDTYHRSGIYKVGLPSGLGMESAGVVEAVGEGVDNVAPGDRVVSIWAGIGAYASAQIVPAAGLIRLPDEIPTDVAAAATLKGCTAEFLIERCAKVKPGMTVLVHAAAGATGQILVQWLAAIGAEVIGTASSPEKAEKAHAAGAAHVIRYDRADTAAQVREITGGEGVPVVLDGVGMATWESSLKSCARRGLVVSFGNASAPVTGVGLATLNDHGSLFVTRPKLFDYYVTAEDKAAGTARLFEMIAGGKVTIEIGQRYPLEDAAQAHRDLEGRRTIGASILLP